MKILLVLFISTLLAASSVAGQTRKANRSKSKRPVSAVKLKTAVSPVPDSYDVPPPPPPKMPKPSSENYSSSDNFKDVAIGKWDIAGLSLPQDLTGGNDNGETVSENKGVSSTHYSRFWRHPAPVYPGVLDVVLMVTTWDADFKEVVPDLRADLATPEYMLLADLLGDMNNKKQPDSFVKEVRPLPLGSVKGGFFRAEYPPSENRFMAGWYTYRYFEGKAQRISLTVTGRKEELEKAMKIIQSLKIQ